MPIKDTFITLKKIFTSNWLLIVIVICILVLGTWFITNRIASYEKTLAVAEQQEIAVKQKEEIIKKSQEDFFEGVKTTKKSITTINNQQTATLKQIQDRTNKLNEQVRGVLADKDLEKVAEDAKNLLELEPEVTANGRVSFSKSDTQLIIALKLDYQKLTSELDDTKSLLAKEQEKTGKLTVELANAVKAIEDSNKLLMDYKVVLDSYKNAARKSKWQRVKDAGKQVAIIGGTILVTKAIVQ